MKGGEEGKKGGGSSITDIFWGWWGCQYYLITSLQRMSSMEHCHNLCRPHPQTPDLFESHGDLRTRQGTHCREGWG